MRWHPVYQDVVLHADYTHARDHLLPHLFDALTAHAQGLARQDLPGAQHAVALLRELRLEPFPPYDPQVEDVFFTLDRQLAARCETAAGALRTALSRNDLDMTLYRLRAREQLVDTLASIETLRAVLLNLAQRELTTLIVAYTHHQPAQPTTLAHYLSALENVLARDTARLHDALGRLNLSPLGAVALAGSSHPLDRDFTATALGFDRPIENTYDAVSTSDWQSELAGALSTVAVTMSRALYDLLFWASRGLISLRDGLVQGSSVMPQKRNPVALEHARTKFSKVLGYAQAVLLSAHNVPFGDINDPGPDVQPALQTLWTELNDGLALVTVSLEGLQINRDAWLDEAQHGETFLTELADVLARSGHVTFREAHHLAQQLLAALRTQGRPLGSVTAADLSLLGCHVPDSLVHEAVSVHEFVNRRRTYGGPAPEVMQQHLEMATSRLKADTARQQSRHDQFTRARSALEGTA